MNGGNISNNHASSSDIQGYGGGVYNSGTFIMNGGNISGNRASANNSIDVYGGYGGGVYNNGTFIMNDGKISGNNAENGRDVSGTVTRHGGQIGS
jgi:hypothetical protein